MAKSKEKSDTLTVEEICLSMLRQGCIPSVRNVRTAGAKGGNASLTKAVKAFKESHADEIEELRVKHALLSNDASRRGGLAFALQHFKARAETAEKALEEMKRDDPD